MTFLPQSYTQFTQTRLLNCHKNNATGNNSANIANEKAFVNRTKEKILRRNKKRCNLRPSLTNHKTVLHSEPTCPTLHYICKRHDRRGNSISHSKRDCGPVNTCIILGSLLSETGGVPFDYV